MIERPDHTGNFNCDILIKHIEPEDFYDGIYVQSFGNSDTIYQIRFIDNEWKYRATHRIEERITGYLNSKLINLELESFKPIIKYPTQTKWYETYYSRKADPQISRNKKLEELGIWDI
jgi:hypothetical protein